MASNLNYKQLPINNCHFSYRNSNPKVNPNIHGTTPKSRKCSYTSIHSWKRLFKGHLNLNNHKKAP